MRSHNLTTWQFRPRNTLRIRQSFVANGKRLSQWFMFPVRLKTVGGLQVYPNKVKPDILSPLDISMSHTQVQRPNYRCKSHISPPNLYCVRSSYQKLYNTCVYFPVGAWCCALIRPTVFGSFPTISRYRTNGPGAPVLHGQTGAVFASSSCRQICAKPLVGLPTYPCLAAVAYWRSLQPSFKWSWPDRASSATNAVCRNYSFPTSSASSTSSTSSASSSNGRELVEHSTDAISGKGRGSLSICGLHWPHANNTVGCWPLLTTRRRSVGADRLTPEPFIKLDIGLSFTKARQAPTCSEKHRAPPGSMLAPGAGVRTLMGVFSSRHFSTGTCHMINLGPRSNKRYDDEGGNKKAARNRIHLLSKCREET